MSAHDPQNPKSGFNLSRWALEHTPLTRYLMIVLMLLGVAAYFQLGQDEDPPFTFRAMVVRAYWPGATAQQMAEQVADKKMFSTSTAAARRRSIRSGQRSMHATSSGATNTSFSSTATNRAASAASSSTTSMRAASTDVSR